MDDARSRRRRAAWSARKNRQRAVEELNDTIAYAAAQPYAQRVARVFRRDGDELASKLQTWRQKIMFGFALIDALLDEENNR